MKRKAKQAKNHIRLNYSWDQSAIDTVCLYQFLVPTCDPILIERDVYTFQ